jgi:hypothetical protein
MWDLTSEKQHLMRAIESPSLPAAAFWFWLVGILVCEESANKYIKRQKCETCRQGGGFWEDSFPSASVNARQKSSIKFATVDQVPGIIKGTSYHRVTEIAAAVDQVFLPGHFNCHKPGLTKISILKSH